MRAAPGTAPRVNSGFALYLVLESRAEENEPFPEPREPGLIAREIVNANAFPALIDTDALGKSLRVNMSMEEGLLERVDRASKAKGMSRSAFLAEAARAALQERA